jgi:hypothetical protein
MEGIGQRKETKNLNVVDVFSVCRYVWSLCVYTCAYDFMCTCESSLL